MSTCGKSERVTIEQLGFSFRGFVLGIYTINTRQRSISQFLQFQQFVNIKRDLEATEEEAKLHSEARSGSCGTIGNDVGGGVALRPMELGLVGWSSTSACE